FGGGRRQRLVHPILRGSTFRAFLCSTEQSFPSRIQRLPRPGGGRWTTTAGQFHRPDDGVCAARLDGKCRRGDLSFRVAAVGGGGRQRSDGARRVCILDICK